MAQSRFSRLAVLALLAIAGRSNSARATTALGSYNVAPSAVTVAGISSGAFMAVQMQVAFSTRFYGTAIFAGGPYACAQDSQSTALGACESGSGLSVSTLVSYANSQATAGTIDPTSNLAGKPIYLFSGTGDTTVHPAVVDALQIFYESFTAASNITFDDTTAAEHAWISPDGPNSCNTSQSPYINNCSKDPEQTFLTLFYGALQPKNTGTLGGTFVQFDQTPFCPSGSCSGISMDSTGWAFVPQSCQSGAACKLIVALHGCLMDQGTIQEDFVKESGLDEWADTNGLIVLYPQTITSYSSPSNPEACWDWWGYTSADYALQSGPQMQALIGMVNQIVGLTSGTSGTTTTNGSATGATGSTGTTGPTTAGNSGTTGGACTTLGLACTASTTCCSGSSCQFGFCLPGSGLTATTTGSTGVVGGTSAGSGVAASGSSSGGVAVAGSSAGVAAASSGGVGEAAREGWRRAARGARRPAAPVAPRRAARAPGARPRARRRAAPKRPAAGRIWPTPVMVEAAAGAARAWVHRVG